ncbi:MAG: Ig-like domain-containing protein, partial [Acidobacteriota bacterium]
MTAADLPLAAPRGGTIAGVVEVDLGGASLTTAASLFFAVDPAPTVGSIGLLLHVDEIDGAATYRAVAAIEPTVGGWTTSTIDPADLAWPGARDGGLYALVELTAPHGYLRGIARDPLGNPLDDAVIASESVDWVQRSNADGSYVLPLPVAADPHTVTVVDPISGDQVAIAVTVDTDGGRVDLDPTVQVTGPWVAEITPGDGAEGVPVGFEPLVRFSEPVDRASLVGAITLSSDGQPIEVDLDHQGDRVTLQPRSTLLPGVGYAISIGLGVRDLTGHPLQSPVATSFTTQADPVTGDRLDRDKVRLFAPGADGLARIVGLAGAVPADTLVYVENLSAFTSTESVTSGLDGSFELTISATLDHRLLLHVLIEGSSEDLLLLGPYLSDDERAAYIPPTGDHRFLTVDGMIVTVDEGTFSAATWVRLEPRDADSDPIETDPDLETAVRFRLDLGGQVAAKPLHVRLPVPVGVDLTGEPDALLLRYIRATYREGWMVDDLLRVEDGAFTNEPPTPKHATRKSSSVESSTFRTPRNSRILSTEDAEMLAADPRAVLPLDPRDVEQAGSIPLPPPWQPSLARSSAKSTFDGSVESATVGVLSSGDYQVALARIPLAWLIVPAIYPDLVAFNHAWDPSMTSYLDSHRFALGHRHFLLPTPASAADTARTDGGAVSKAASSWELQVIDTATGYELYHETGNPPTGEPIVLEADVYGDVAPPLPVGGSPLRFVLIQTPPDGVLDVEVAPGITVTSLDGELKATGVSGTVGDRVQVQLVTAGGSSRSIGASEADGSFEVAVSGVRPGEIVVLTAGAVLAVTDRIEIAWSETLSRSSARSGLQVFPYIDDKLAETPIEVDPLIPGTGEVAYLRPPTGWRSGRYVLRLDGSLSDEAVPPNSWPRQLDGSPWETPLDIEFEVAQSGELGPSQVPRVAAWSPPSSL